MHESPAHQLAGSDPGCLHTVEGDPAARGAQHARDGLQRRGLACTVGTDDRDDFSLGDVKIENVNDLEAVVARANLVKLQHGGVPLQGMPQ